MRCAPGTDVTVGTVVGQGRAVGPLGAVRVATVSGKIRVDEAARIDVRTKSGKIDIGTCAGECRVMTKSSTVHVAQRGQRDRGRASRASCSWSRSAAPRSRPSAARCSLGSSGGERVSVHTVSGKVEIRVPAAARPATRLRSISGRIECDFAPGDDFEIAVVERERRDPGVERLMAEHGAIVFTDIVGFTALTDMHGDDVALALLERQERMVRAALPASARVVKELGDGLLLWFDDPARGDRHVPAAAARVRRGERRGRCRRHGRRRRRVDRRAEWPRCRCGCASACTGAARASGATTSSAAT